MKRRRRYKIARETWPLLGDFLRTLYTNELQGCPIPPGLAVRYAAKTMLAYIDGAPPEHQAALITHLGPRTAIGARSYAEGLAAFCFRGPRAQTNRSPAVETIDEGPDLVAREVRGFRTMHLAWAKGGLALRGAAGGLLTGPISPPAVCLKDVHDPPHFRCCGYYAASGMSHPDLGVYYQTGNSVLVDISAVGRTIIGEEGFQTARYQVEGIMLNPLLAWLLSPERRMELERRFGCAVTVREDEEFN